MATLRGPIRFKTMSFYRTGGKLRQTQNTEHDPAGRLPRKPFNFNGLWWALQDSNLRLPPCEGGTLPLS